MGAWQVGGRLLFAAIPPGARLPAITGTAACAVLLLAALPGLRTYTGMSYAMTAAVGTAAVLAAAVSLRTRP